MDGRDAGCAALARHVGIAHFAPDLGQQRVAIGGQRRAGRRDGRARGDRRGARAGERRRRPAWRDAPRGDGPGGRPGFDLRRGRRRGGKVSLGWDGIGLLWRIRRIGRDGRRWRGRRFQRCGWLRRFGGWACCVARRRRGCVRRSRDRRGRRASVASAVAEPPPAQVGAERRRRQAGRRAPAAGRASARRAGSQPPSPPRSTPPVRRRSHRVRRSEPQGQGSAPRRRQSRHGRRARRSPPSPAPALAAGARSANRRRFATPSGRVRRPRPSRRRPRSPPLAPIGRLSPYSPPKAAQSSGSRGGIRPAWGGNRAATVKRLFVGWGWRREWDSNPRYGFPYTHFPGVRLRPLGHPSMQRCRRAIRRISP